MYLYYFETEPKQIELKGTEELDQMLADPHDGVVETLKIVGRFQGASHVLTDKHEVAISLHPSQQRVTLFVRERSV
ncbi:MAG: hypothetical protein KatS3mg105_5050 [Gemmatales bacterium]|nr:MAG: hypothetical protein KatS3mg105_5050 [Gemmatales bacterium]